MKNNIYKYGGEMRIKLISVWKKRVHQGGKEDMRWMGSERDRNNIKRNMVIAEEPDGRRT